MRNSIYVFIKIEDRYIGSREMFFKWLGEHEGGEKGRKRTWKNKIELKGKKQWK